MRITIDRITQFKGSKKDCLDYASNLLGYNFDWKTLEELPCGGIVRLEVVK